MKIYSIDVNEILIEKNRQRKSAEEEDIIRLASSITQIGLIHPVVVRADADKQIILVAGERRIRAMTHLWFFGQKVKCGEFEFDEEQVPCIYQGEMSQLDAMEMELEENIRRVDLSWQDRAKATGELAALKRERAQEEGRPPPSLEEIAAETHGTGGGALELARAEILVTPHLADPDIAKATNARDALKILKRKEERSKYVNLAEQTGKSLKSLHTLHQGDCFDILSDISDGTFDVILTDPPYGIDADQFSDSGGRVAGAHFYDDSWRTWNSLAQRLAKESFRVAKPSAHAYIFCDVDNFVLLKGYFLEANWRVFRTPLVWVNPTAMRAPWPEHGPQRKYQICLYAIKGDRTVNAMKHDVVTYPSDDNLGNGAQKPLALYLDLLARSVHPGDSVLDPFGGTGVIIPAAHELKCQATYIEQDTAQYGIAVSRLQGLK